MLTATLLLAAACATAAGRSLNQTTTAVATPACGRPQLLASGVKVVGGEAAFHGQLPWTVSIQLSGQHFCGGTLVGRQHVLSAAHCFHGRSRQAFSVVVGEHDLRVDEAAQRRLAVARLVVHADYKYPSYRNDIALLQLAEPVGWGLYAQPACLPAADAASPAGRRATVAGWGWLDEYRKGGKRSDVLQRADVTVRARATCNQWFAEADKSITLKAGQLCAGFKAGGKDACQGDSGGPLVVSTNGTYTLVGIVSAGIGCARPSLPGIYTDVHHYGKWIAQKLEDSAQ